ncbi:Retrovirus-related Pol polyprotein LINE-1, partial [Glycine soja]
ISFRTIDQQQNSLLGAPFQEIEIQNAVGECGSDKSPCPDGFNFRFIKQFWDILKPDILRYIHEFHANGAIPRGCNASFIALIPKRSEPQHLGEYRPISLIGCMYKIVAKLLANRIRKVMAAIIDETQFAFI